MLPFFDDLTFHLFPALLLGADALLLSPPWPSRPANPQAPLITLTLTTAFAFAYWFWIELCFSHNGFYPYPLFALLNTWQRVGLFMLCAVTMWVIGAGQRVLYAWANGMEVAEVGEKIKKGQ